MTFLSISERVRLEAKISGQGWKRPDSAAVVVCCRNRAALVAYIGHGIEVEIGVVGTDTSDLGLDDPPRDGIWMWEGYYAVYETPSTPNGPSEYDTYPVGGWRALTHDEFERLRDGKPIWNREDWYTKEEFAEMRAEEEKENP